MSKISMETELDKNIDALALTRAKCNYYLAKGQCESCERCDIKAAYDFGMANMQPVDRLRVNNQAAAYYNEMIHVNARSLSGFRELVKFVGKYISIAAAIFIIPSALMLCQMNMPGDVTLYDTTAEDDELIEVMLQHTQDGLYDVNRDGQINCIDYTTCFMEAYWEYVPYTRRADCEIVRNVNPGTGMNHLFIRYKSTDKKVGWVYIEPQGTIDCCIMSEYWGNKYDRRYNYYGETQWWMSRRK